MEDQKYEIVMRILEDERLKELECAMIAREMMRKSLNPIKRISLKLDSERFMNHSIAVQIAMHRIKRELSR